MGSLATYEFCPGSCTDNMCAAYRWVFNSDRYCYCPKMHTNQGISYINAAFCLLTLVEPIAQINIGTTLGTKRFIFSCGGNFLANGTAISFDDFAHLATLPVPRQVSHSTVRISERVGRRRTRWISTFPPRLKPRTRA